MSAGECEVCQGPLPAGHRADRRHCSQRCSYWNFAHPGEVPPRLDRRCPVCHDALPAGSTSQRRTCSRRCYYWSTAHPGKPLPPRKCVRCGAPVPGKRTGNKWCSRVCRNARSNKARFAQKRGAKALPFTDAQLQARLSMFPGCWMCGGPKQEVEHVKPLSRGGWHILANLRPACKPCNLRKRDAWPWAVANVAA